MTIGVTYDSDVEGARKLIKQIGQQLAQDPEFAPLIIEPLKMQGIEQFGDYAVQIRTKMMTVPGEQFVIRAGIGPSDFQAIALEDPGIARQVHRQLADVPGRIIEDTDGLSLSRSHPRKQ